MYYYLVFCILTGAGLVHLARRERSKPVSAVRKTIPTRNDPWVWWGRYLIVLFVAAVLLALSGCTSEAEPAPPPLPTPGIPGSPAKTALPPVLYVDNETGCHYLGTGDPAAPLVPRMDRDGKQVCK